jgi:hypothetical protein
MSAALIELAAEHLGCAGQTAAGKWLYHDPATGWWIVTDDDMETLGRMLGRWDAVTAVHAWCRETTATEADIDGLVREFSITAATNLDRLQESCRVSGITASFLVLKYARADVLAFVRFNAETEASR